MATLHETHTVWDHSIAPIHEVDPGATVELEVTDASGGQLDKDSSVDAVAALDFSHVNPVTGPVFVKGAEPGRRARRSRSSSCARATGAGRRSSPASACWPTSSPSRGCGSPTSSRARRVAFLDGVALPFEPFPGTIGVAPAEPGEHSIVPPTRWGGNIDIKHLRAGTTLLLPVGVEGALFSVGDTHAAMGDGEVCGTAVEAPMDIAVRLSVRRDVTIAAPQYVVAPGELARTEAGGYHVCTGVGPDLMEATPRRHAAAIAHIVERRGARPRRRPTRCASVACDLRIHEIVDVPNWVVGCFVPDASSRGRHDEQRRRAGRGLRRELRFWEAIALSIAIMAPTAAMALNGVGVAAR